MIHRPIHVYNKDIPPKYCPKCGSTLSIKEVVSYDTMTGEKKTHNELACPDLCVRFLEGPPWPGFGGTD